MSLTSRVLGKPGDDNALFAKIDTGKNIHRFLMDTGSNCLWQLNRTDLSHMDHILFSHFHADHISGFDSIFRLIFNRPQPIHIWGPDETIKVIQARAMGYTWNLVSKSTSKIIIHEIKDNKITTVEIKLKEGFSKIHQISIHDHKDDIIYKNKDYTIKATVMDHKIDCMAYSLEETEKENLDLSKLNKLGIENLKPGPWCQEIKNKKEGTIEIQESSYDIKKIRDQILVTTKGSKLGYITDIIYNEDAAQKLCPMLHQANEVVMECAYLESEKNLADKHHHMTVKQVSSFAKRAEIEKLTLFHISDRYPPVVRLQFLQKAREIFENTHYPNHWKIEL